MEQVFQIFLASNFSEFESIRTRLKDVLGNCKAPPLSVVDLNDRRARHNSPLITSIDAAQQAEVMVLLLGTQYGGRPKGEPENSKSYIHREYLAARKKEGMIILPFLFDRVSETAENILSAKDSIILSEWKRPYTE